METMDLYVLVEMIFTQKIPRKPIILYLLLVVY